MPPHPRREFRPLVEWLERKQPLSAGLATAPAVVSSTAANPTPIKGVTIDRVTNVRGGDGTLSTPILNILVQTRQPIPGQVYNVLYLNVYNGTKQTFTASDGLTVRTSSSPPGTTFPILTGDEVWKPGQRIVFYVLSKRYYPLTPTQSAGFQFNFVEPRVTGIPGPSGIFLGVKYNPATINNVIDYIVSHGPGTINSQVGITDTANWLIPVTSHYIHL